MTARNAMSLAVTQFSHLDDVESLLDKFYTLPLDTLSQIRHVRTRAMGRLR